MTNPIDGQMIVDALEKRDHFQGRLKFLEEDSKKYRLKIELCGIVLCDLLEDADLASILQMVTSGCQAKLAGAEDHLRQVVREQLQEPPPPSPLGIMDRTEMLRRACTLAEEQVVISSCLPETDYAALQQLGDDKQAVKQWAKRILAAAVQDFDELTEDDATERG